MVLSVMKLTVPNSRKTLEQLNNHPLFTKYSTPERGPQSASQETFFGTVSEHYFHNSVMPYVRLLPILVHIQTSICVPTNTPFHFVELICSTSFLFRVISLLRTPHYAVFSTSAPSPLGSHIPFSDLLSLTSEPVSCNPPVRLWFCSVAVDPPLTSWRKY
jgi:hypothetical protein